jgi:integrase/recombinase XerD
LRTYWREYHPVSWLFYARTPQSCLTKGSFQRAYSRAKLKAEVHKLGGIHGLRHAYATHQLESGMPVTQLQHQLGHAQVSTTLRSAHLGEKLTPLKTRATAYPEIKFSH